MKAKYLIVALLCAAAAAGCQKASQYHDLVYFTGTEMTPEVKFSILNPGESIGLTVSSSKKAESPMTVSLAPDPGALEAYNNEYGRLYKLIPDGAYSLGASSVVIDKGQNMSAQVRFSVTDLSKFEEGVTYCMPVSIKSVDDGTAVLEPSRTAFVVVKRTIVTRAANLNDNTYFMVKQFDGNTEYSAMTDVTMEARVLMNGFETRNPFISTIIGTEENFLLRVGDVSAANNQLQEAGAGLSLSSNFFFTTGVWHHVAVTYGNNTISIYVDGKLDVSMERTKVVNLGYQMSPTAPSFCIGISVDANRTFNGYISEARVWNRALTATELENNLCYVDPLSPGLLAYWRFNGDNMSGNDATDLTGHGFTATANRAVTWVDDVKCPDNAH